jgi:hypothetical protein
MKTDEFINEFINREKELKHNPYLANRIMASLGTPQRRTIGFLQYVAIAACISTVVVMGMTIGNSYNVAPKEYSSININDSEMENFAIYNSTNNE